MSTPATKKVLAVDCGFGSTKVCYATNEGTLRFDKFISAIARVSKSDIVNDALAIDFNGNNYYVADNATRLPNANLLDLMSYNGLREASPILIKYIVDKYDYKFDILVLGLSVTMINQSADYKKYVAETLYLSPENIRLVPQGIGSKLAYDRYNLNPNDDTQLSGTRVSNYLGVDIGFNTIDVFQVINGQSSANTIKGFEGKGVFIVANRLVDYIESEFKIKPSLQTVKGVLESGTFYHRGTTYKLGEKIDELILQYISETMTLIEENFKESIDRMERIMLVGGGAALVRKYQKSAQSFLEQNYRGDFIVIPASAEYFNVLGYYAVGSTVTITK